MEGFVQDKSSGLAEKESAHVDSHNLASLPVLLHAVADVIELSEGGAQLIEVLTQQVGVQLLHGAGNHLWEPDDALP